jgi:hypothetical protein
MQKVSPNLSSSASAVSPRALMVALSPLRLPGPPRPLDRHRLRLKGNSWQAKTCIMSSEAKIMNCSGRLSLRSELIQVVSPPLHHFSAFRQVLRVIVSCSNGVPFTVGNRVRSGLCWPCCGIHVRWCVNGSPCDTGHRASCSRSCTKLDCAGLGTDYSGRR